MKIAYDFMNKNVFLITENKVKMIANTFNDTFCF